MPMTNLEISKILHGMMSAFREGIGETPYPKWEGLDQPTIDLYDGAIELIKQYEYYRITPKRIHQFWQEWAKTHRPDHLSLPIAYEDLSQTEKIKDMFVISIVNDLLNSEIISS